MPKNATLAQRVRWHNAHAKACGCRTDIPADIRKTVKAQQAAGKR
jgi:hypothetical protein